VRPEQHLAIIRRFGNNEPSPSDRGHSVRPLAVTAIPRAATPHRRHRRGSVLQAVPGLTILGLVWDLILAILRADTPSQSSTWFPRIKTLLPAIVCFSHMAVPPKRIKSRLLLREQLCRIFSAIENRGIYEERTG
jgi:hypothetical protein